MAAHEEPAPRNIAGELFEDLRRGRISPETHALAARTPSHAVRGLFAAHDKATTPTVNNVSEFSRESGIAFSRVERWLGDLTLPLGHSAEETNTAAKWAERLGNQLMVGSRSLGAEETWQFLSPEGGVRQQVSLLYERGQLLDNGRMPGTMHARVSFLVHDDEGPRLMHVYARSRDGS